MKAVVVHGAQDLRVTEVPDPVCGAAEVLVKMEWGGICGSDLSYVKSGTSGTAVLREPLILGHEVAGVVVEVGKDVTDVPIGSKVALFPATCVGEHDFPAALAGRENLWPEVRYFGSAAFLPHEQGGFAEYRVVRPDQLRFLPENVSTKVAAVAEPFAVALHAVKRAGDICGKRILVNGAGPIGALSVAAAKALGAAEVIAADLSDSALTIAQQMGADEVRNIGNGAQLPTDVAVAIEASGVAKALGGVFAATQRGGIVVQVGNLPGGEVAAQLGNIVTREIEYRGSYRFADEMNLAIELLAQKVDVRPLQTHTFPLVAAAEAFAVAADRSTGSSKVMLQLS